MTNIDTSIEGFKKAGIVLTQEQLSTLGMINDMFDSSEIKMFLLMVVLRQLNILPEKMMCECEEKYGRVIDKP